jgi:hypothetical protein
VYRAGKPGVPSTRAVGTQVVAGDSTKKDGEAIKWVGVVDWWCKVASARLNRLKDCFYRCGREAINGCRGSFKAVLLSFQL